MSPLINTRLLAGRDFLEELAQLAHGNGRAVQFGISTGAALQRFIFALQAAGFEGPAHDQQQPVGVEGLFDIFIGAALDGGDRRFNVAVARNDDNGHVLMLLLDGLQEIEPVEFGTLQPDIENDQRRAALIDFSQRGVAVMGKAGFVALVLQNASDQFADVGLVINYQNVSSHCSTHSAEIKRGSGRRENSSVTWAPLPEGASCRRKRPPCSSMMRLTIARPRPVPFSRVVM